MSTIAIELRLQLDCAGCETRSVIPTLAEDVRCPSCGRGARIELARWSRALAKPISRSLEKPDNDWYWANEDDGDDDAAAGLRIEYKRWPPVCPSCRAGLQLGELGPAGITCSCGARISVRELPAAIEAPGLPRPAWLIGEGAVEAAEIPSRISKGAWLDSLWLVARTSHAGLLTRDASRHLHGLCADRSGALIMIYQQDKHGRICKLDGDEVVWETTTIGFDYHSWLIGAPDADEVAIVDPRGNAMHFVGTHDGRFLRTLQGPVPEHEGRRGAGFQRKEPQTIDVYYGELLGVGLTADGTIVIARDWYDGLSKSIRRFDRDGRPKQPWRKRPGFLRTFFAGEREETFRDIVDRPLALYNWNDRFAVARNGALIAYGSHPPERWIERWHPDGKVAGTALLPAWVTGVVALAGDAAGAPVLLCDREGVGRVVAILRGTELDVIGGPYGNDEEHLHVFDDGRIAIARRGDSLRVLAPDGKVLWKSRETELADRERQSP